MMGFVFSFFGFGEGVSSPRFRGSNRVGNRGDEGLHVGLYNLVGSVTGVTREDLSIGVMTGLSRTMLAEWGSAAGVLKEPRLPSAILSAGLMGPL